MDKFTYQESPNFEGYYVLATYCKNGKIMNRRDKPAAEMIGLSVKEFRNYMQSLFNAELMHYSNHTLVVHIKEEKDIRAAVEWMESTRIIKKMKVCNNE